MATKQFYATKDFKYGTRMMRAGDSVDLNSPAARLYLALGAVSPDRPRKTADVPSPAAPAAPAVPAVQPVSRKRRRKAKK
jgi:hypothetical protein